MPPQQAQTTVPQTREQLDAVMLQRQELKSQLEDANGRRSELAEQVRRAGGDVATRSDPEARLKSLDGRIARLERAIDQADDAISSAIARGVGHDVTTVPPPPPIPDLPPPFPTGWEGFTEAHVPWNQQLLHTLNNNQLPITLATLVLLGTFMYWRVSRSVRDQVSRLMTIQSTRLEEIQRSVDTMAVEVERVSEGQRFVTKVMSGEPTSRGV